MDISYYLAYFYPKQKNKILKYLQYFFFNISKIQNVDKGGRGGGQPMWIIFKFYNIIIKSANVDNGGEQPAYPQNKDKKGFFFNPSLTSVGLQLIPTCIMYSSFQ